MIDGRFSREAFESLRSPIERRLLARELAEEIREAIASIPTADGAFSSILARLRLIGHHLYPCGDGLFTSQGDAATPATGLSLLFGPGTIEVRYR